MAETIGWLTDKILVTELKIYYTNRQLTRKDIDRSHRKMCRERVRILRRQRDDLKEEFSRLFGEVMAGRAAPKLYRQFKMYNDPRFMPSLRHRK